MKYAWIIITLLVFTFQSHAAEVLEIRLPDGEVTKGKLHLPDAPVKLLVFHLHGTGPNTYENPRKFGDLEFKYCDMFGEEFNRRGIAFFTYNRRGVTIGDKPPMFDEVDREKFKEVRPSIEVDDIGAIIATLRKNERLKNAKVALIGWSEGTMLASLVAEKKENDIAALLLCGYAHENLFDIIKWQYSGASSMQNLRPPFDKDNDGNISKQEYESKDKLPTAWREKVMKGAKFTQLDANQDNTVNIQDFQKQLEPAYNQVLAKIKQKDADWVWKNYFRVSIEWLEEHRELEPNKKRLLRLDIPIYIFHGEADANVDVAGAKQLEASFKQSKKENLKVFTFEGHNHDLNFQEWPMKKETIPEGIQKMFEIAEELNRD